MFAASPQYTMTTQGFGGASSLGGPSFATASFDRVAMTGARPGGWTGEQIGAGDAPTGGTLARSGRPVHGPRQRRHRAARVGPRPGGFPTSPVEDHLAGAFAGLIAIAVVATMFITAEYRRGLIRVTLAASPRRGQVLAAKAIVVGAVAFVGRPGRRRRRRGRSEPGWPPPWACTCHRSAC